MFMLQDGRAAGNRRATKGRKAKTANLATPFDIPREAKKTGELFSPPHPKV